MKADENRIDNKEENSKFFDFAIFDDPQTKLLMKHYAAKALWALFVLLIILLSYLQ